MVSSFSNVNSGREILKVSNLVAGYRRDLPIVIDVSMEVYEGEILTLLGPNGAGKSTLIKGICGLVEVISGNVVFQGVEISNLETYEIIERRVAYVPQTQNVFAKLSVSHNLDLGAISNVKAYEERLEKVFTLFPDLWKFKDTSAGKLSGGHFHLLVMPFRQLHHEYFLAIVFNRLDNQGRIDSARRPKGTPTNSASLSRSNFRRIYYGKSMESNFRYHWKTDVRLYRLTLCLILENWLVNRNSRFSSGRAHEELDSNLILKGHLDTRRNPN